MKNTHPQPVAILYQKTPPPVIDGIRKPMKDNGYSDSGADIAFSLRKNGVEVVTSVNNPDPACDLDWVFPDTETGIQQAIQLGAKVLWANTVLFEGHPLEKFLKQGIKLVGQPPALVQKHDDKWATNCLLREKGLSVTPSILVSDEVIDGAIPLSELSIETLQKYDLELPLVVKPVRGRGSQGVVKVNSFEELIQQTQSHLNETESVNGEEFSKYGACYMLEQYMDGVEITATVMPAGEYEIGGKLQYFAKPWSLPLVERFNHQDGIAPYNGVVAVTENSRVIPVDKMTTEQKEIMEQCAKAGEIIGIKAPIRVDCRADKNGNYTMFDLNMKPNMTGAGRPNRENQNSLTAIASAEIGWDFDRLLLNILRQGC